MLNKVIIMGRLTRDPEIKKVNSDISVCSFSIACDRDIVNKQNNERETDFFDVTAWRSTADFVGKYFGKGLHDRCCRLGCRSATTPIRTATSVLP